MKLSTLMTLALPQIAASRLPGMDPEVTNVTHNSDWVTPGCIYVAIRGQHYDAHHFLPQALERGAIAIIGEGYPQAANLPIPYLHVPDARQALALIAIVLQGAPGSKLKLIGVTGTKGKTTTSWLTYHILHQTGHRTGLISTVGYKVNSSPLLQFPTHFTTPEAPQVQCALREMADLSCEYAVIEASSHGLALQRLHGLAFEVGIWTNLSPEHLDFHGTMEYYFTDKRRLIDGSRYAVLNADDSWAMRLNCRQRLTYGLGVGADWSASQIVESPKGIQFVAKFPGGTCSVTLPMIGQYNIPNALAAMAACARIGIPINHICAALSTFPGVPGRMQLLQESPIRIIVDFAHTPGSLEHALKALRPTTQRHLIVVIGSAGGNRYPGKRAPLGSVATEYADLAIFTEEDCRTTPIAEILEDMQRGAEAAERTNYVLIPDRYQAIKYALEHAHAGDTVVLAGKGPEATLERANETLPWNEAQIALDLLRERQVS